METRSRSGQLTGGGGQPGGPAGAGGGRNGGRDAEDGRGPSPDRPPSPPPMIHQEDPPPSPHPQQQPPPIPDPTQTMLQQLLAAAGDMRHKNQQLQAQMHPLQAEQDGGEDEWEEPQSVVGFQPYSPAVAAVEIPEKLKNFPWKLYEGNTDPGEHLMVFNLKMVNCGASDALRCRLFPETFARRANEWFTSLAPGSVYDFTDLSARFLAQFSASREEKAITQLLLAMMQGENESLRSYLKSFTDHSTPLESFSRRANEWFTSLAPGSVHDFTDLCARFL